MPPDVLIHANDLDGVEPGRVVDEHALSFGQDRRVGGVPRHSQALGDPGDAQVLDHDVFQCPPQATA